VLFHLQPLDRLIRFGGNTSAARSMRGFNCQFSVSARHGATLAARRPSGSGGCSSASSGKTRVRDATVANMRENGVRVVSATCEACGHKADVSRRRPARDCDGPKGRPAPTVQPMRREGDIDQARMAYGPTRWRSRLSVGLVRRRAAIWEAWLTFNDRTDWLS
jgi:hypothetical protein